MGTVKDERLFEATSSYIVDGVLVKFRWSSNDETTMEYKLENKCINSSELTKEDLEFLKSKGNLVVQTGQKVELINFDRERLDHVNKVKSFYELPQYDAQTIELPNGMSVGTLIYLMEGDFENGN